MTTGAEGSTTTEGPEDRVEHSVQFPTHILSEESEHEVTVLLQQLVLSTIARDTSFQPIQRMSRLCS